MEGGRNPDIRVERNGETHYIDVVVACPTSEEAIRSGAKDTKGVAADLAEKRKLRQYEQRGQVVVPFAVESHGVFGAAATKYLSRLSVRVRIFTWTGLTYCVGSAAGLKLTRNQAAPLPRRRRIAGGIGFTLL